MRLWLNFWRGKLGRCPKPCAPRAKTFLERKVLDSKELKTGSFKKTQIIFHFLVGKGPHMEDALI
jgi:hypothetical protein